MKNLNSIGPKIIVVIPCYNEEVGLNASLNTLRDILTNLIDLNVISADSFILLIDDGSSDLTWNIIEEQSRLFCNVEGLKLSRNFGHQAALLAGLEFSVNRCDAAISIDADLQQDPYAIKAFVEKYIDGSDVVVGVRRSRETDNVSKRVSASLFYYFMKMMGVSLIPNHADYRLLSNKALNALQKYHENNIFLRAICLNLGFKVGVVEFDVSKRVYGNTKYSLKKMIKLARDGVVSFSFFPLRLVSFIGLTIFLVTSVMLIFILWNAIVLKDTIPGWASITLPIYFIGGIQLLCLGIIGEYIAQIYSGIKNRPRWILDKSTRQIYNDSDAQAIERNLNQ